MISLNRSATSKEKELAAARTAAVGHINTVVGQLRVKFITSLPGQEMIYSAKEAEAKAFLAEDPEPLDLTGYPFLAAEVGITAANARDLADLWLAMAASWRTVGPQLETLRLGAITAIEDAADVAEITARLAAFDASAEDF